MEDVKMMLQIPDWSPKLLEEAGINEEVLAKMGYKLDEFIDEFRPCFANTPQIKPALMYIKGLMSDLKRKNIENMVEGYGEIKETRPMQAFMKDALV
ncbi:MAG: hypothetical protein LBV23_07215 [Deltaproteobacteria bacterium]|jgi:hypothetical protein|nr:hypothetical protein [Deltaproteobacteria bacterium]